MGYLRRITALVSILVVMTGVAHGASLSVETRKDDVVFRLSLPKSDYVYGEPIIAKFTLVNKAAEKRWLAELSTYSMILDFRITQVSGTEKLPPPWVPSVLGAPSDFRWEFLPGEQRSEHKDLQGKFDPLTIPVGEYTVTAIYTAPNNVKDIWQGTIVTPELAFTVVPATGSCVQASEDFSYARRRISDGGRVSLEAAKILHRLAEPDGCDIFSQYAGFWEAAAYSGAKDEEKALASFQRYMQDHSDVPCYGRLAAWNVGTQSFYAGKYKEARDAFMHLPDGYKRRDWIKRCDEKEKETK